MTRCVLERCGLAAVGFGVLLLAGCANRGDRYVAATGNQGNFSVQREANPVDSLPREPARSAAPAGPTAREVELQRHIDDLEARQKALNAEIERLKQEKSKG